MATGLKAEGLPMVDLFSAALGSDDHFRRLENDAAAIAAAKAGYSPGLRQVPRTERINLGILYETFVGHKAKHSVDYQQTAEYKIDFFTNKLHSPGFEAARIRARSKRMES
jgi:hypothetical protein